MPKVRSLKELKAHLQEKINDVLLHETGEYIKEMELTFIDELVYKKYSPTKYDRREENGGLKDPDNIKVELESDGVLVVSNETLFSQEPISSNQGNELIGLIEYGSGGYKNYAYEYFRSDGNSTYAQPRPVISKTAEYIEDYVSNDLMLGLKKAGLNVRRN